ncbi:MAG: DMT family transporter [Alphaproteobacteria bacterium]
MLTGRENAVATREARAKVKERPSTPREAKSATASTKPASLRVAESGADEPLAGILLVMASMIVFSCSDATAKYLTQSLPAVEVAWLRYATFVVLIVPAIVRHGGTRLHSRNPGLQLVRGFTLLASSLFFILAISAMPMADATATTFVSPLLTTALSIPFLGEKVGIRRWAAIVVGMIGVIIVVRPGTSAFNPAAVFPLLSAASWSLAMVITRKMSGADGMITMLTYAAGSGFVALSMALPLVWVTPVLWQVALGIFIGIASSAGQWLVVLAYRRADASVLAPFSYSQIVWSSLLGMAVFGNVPDAQTMIGAAVIVASGIYTAHRERAVRRRRPAPPGKTAA